jgi:hypothetical protein
LPRSANTASGRLAHQRGLQVELLLRADERDHDLREHRLTFAATSIAASKIGARLHLGDLGVRDPRRQPRCPSIGFDSLRSWMRSLTCSTLLPRVARQLGDARLVVGQELVQRGIQRPDR